MNAIPSGTAVNASATLCRVSPSSATETVRVIVFAVVMPVLAVRVLVVGGFRLLAVVGGHRRSSVTVVYAQGHLRDWNFARRDALYLPTNTP